MSTNYRDIAPAEPPRSPFPIILLAAACCLVGIWSIFSTGLIGADRQVLPLILSGLMLGFIALFEIRVGLAVLLLAIGLSPEIEILGISNFRYEDIIFPILFMVWLTKHTISNRSFAKTNLKVPVALIIFLSLLTSLNNMIHGDLELQASVLRFGKSVLYYFIFLIVLNSLKGLRDLKAFAALMLVSSAFVGAYGLTQYNFIGDGVRVTGPPGETANVLGGYYVFHMCLATGLFTRARGSSRVILLAYLVLMTLPFVQTLSRTSYVAYLVGFFAIWMVGKNRSIAVLLILPLLIAVLSPSAVAERFLSIFGIFEGAGPSSWDARVGGWQVLFALNQAPILGRGVGTMPLGAVDNEYMLQLNELGVLGLIVFLWLMITCLKTSFRLRNQVKDRTASGFCLGYFGGCVALLVHSIGATTFTTIRTTEPFFFATGLLYVCYNLYKKDNPDVPEKITDLPLIGRAMQHHRGPLIGRGRV